MPVSTVYYINSDSFSTATSVYMDANLSIIAPDGYYSFDGLYRLQSLGVLSEVITCGVYPPPPPTIDCVSYTVATSSSSGQSYSYLDCTDALIDGAVGGAGGYDANTFCARPDSVTLLGSELTLIINEACT